MAIPKKGSRSIPVNDINYRWLIRKKATYAQSDYGIGKLHVAIELEENPGTSLFIYTDRRHPNDIETEIVDPVKPSDITKWVKQALELEWIPSKKGKPFRTKIVNEKMELE
ncbi:hypothetical protein [Aureibacter tunicatorum]|uniref:Uncharacterized protein n=1 Tax=Aureibacter tunicatorum TaxID=866807 RepID=A0AAE3XQ95_9BACT|nr:hypothetical protein [Aureibacter tunicatorum]MDR6241142.1 hypothetical protein [Aureibacter tunicatorum]BDD03919.1 hypothetical protein AUTU_14020 [Aureibacter tunicatorum]